MEEREMWYRRYDDYAKKSYDNLISNPKLSEKNRQYIKDYLRGLRVADKSERTVTRHIYSLAKLLEATGFDRDLKTLTRDDIERVVEIIKERDPPYSEATRLHFNIVWRAFYKRIMDTPYYPENIAWLRTVGKEQKKLIPEATLEEKEILQLMEACKEDSQMRLLCAMLWELGGRASEILGIRKKDCKLEQKIAKINITGKTGYRQCIVIFSRRFLAEHLNNIKDLEDNQIIWRQKKYKTLPLSYSGALMQLKRLAKETGISKAVNMQAWRRARATFLSTQGGFSDWELKQWFGWSPNTRVLNHYLSGTPKQLADKYMVLNGVKVEDDSNEPLLKVVTCQVCKEEIPSTSLFCGRCGNPKDIQTSLAVQREESFGMAAASDQKLYEEFILHRAQQIIKAKTRKK